MTVSDLIKSLQELVSNNPSLANAGVTRELKQGSSTPIVKIETFPSFGYVKLT
jgi:hypothetical protein